MCGLHTWYGYFYAEKQFLSPFKMIFVAYGEKSLCDKGIPVWSFVLCGGSQSKQVCSCGFPAWNPCDGHLVTINLDYLPQIWQSP